MVDAGEKVSPASRLEKGRTRQFMREKRRTRAAEKGEKEMQAA